MLFILVIKREKMIIIISAIVFITILTQIPNILGINNASRINIRLLFKISLYTLPFNFFATATLYTFFMEKVAYS